MSDEATPKKRRTQERKVQGHIEGMEPPTNPKKNPKVHNLALKYVSVRDERMAMTTGEVAAKKALMAAMEEDGISEYEYGDLKVTINAKKNVKVKVGDDSGEDEGDDE
jgi:hypothetical protein